MFSNYLNDISIVQLILRIFLYFKACEPVELPHFFGLVGDRCNWHFFLECIKLMIKFRVSGSLFSNEKKFFLNINIHIQKQHLMLVELVLFGQ